MNGRAVADALRALRTLDPALRRWIEDGHPNLTDAEHRARFGRDYHPSRSSSPRARATRNDSDRSAVTIT